MSKGTWLRRENLTQIVLAAEWVAFTVVYIGFFYVFQDAKEIADASLDGYLEVVLLGVPSIVLLAATMWLRDAAIDTDLRPRILGWTNGMTLFFVVTIYTALFVVETQFDPGERWLMLVMSAGIGASAGTIMGAIEVRSKQRERDRLQAIEIAKRKERKRSQLEYLNQYLRHEVLNEANQISGYAALLEDRVDADESDARFLRYVRESGEEIAAFIESIRTILDATDHEPELEPVELVSIVESEASRINAQNAGVTVAVHATGPVHVFGGDLLQRVFHNLFENAVEHNSSPVAIGVTIQSEGERVRVRVSDDGDGVPAAKRSSLFEPPTSGDHGYGMFLTKNLVELYGGRLELHETSPDGTVFDMRFVPACRAQDVVASADGDGATTTV
jgi:signal transduction histidine kinase